MRGTRRLADPRFPPSRALLASVPILLLGIIAYLLVLAAGGAEFLKGNPRTVVNTSSRG